MKPALLQRCGLLRDQRGVSAVEFALLAVPFFTILMGGSDLAHSAYVKSQLQGALSDSARLASVQDPGFTAAGTSLEERIENTVKAQVDPVAPRATYTIEISNFYDFSGIGNPEKLMTDVNANGSYDAADNDCFEDLNENGSYDTDTGRAGVGGANDVVFYRATLTMPRLFPVAGWLGLSNTTSLEASSAVRNQPYADQALPPVLCGV